MAVRILPVVKTIIPINKVILLPIRSPNLPNTGANAAVDIAIVSAGQGDIDASRSAEGTCLRAVRSMGHRDSLFEDFLRLIAGQGRCEGEIVFRAVDGQASGLACRGVDGVTRPRGHKLNLRRNT